MSQLIVRDIDPEIVRQLKERAARKGRSAEAEHREILRAVLLGEGRRSLKVLLLAIPPVGTDSDFRRPRRLGRKVRL